MKTDKFIQLLEQLEETDWRSVIEGQPLLLVDDASLTKMQMKLRIGKP